MISDPSYVCVYVPSSSVGIFAKKLCKELWIMSELACAYQSNLNPALGPQIRCMGKSQFYILCSGIFCARV